MQTHSFQIPRTKLKAPAISWRSSIKQYQVINRMRLLTCEIHEQLKDFNWVNQIKMCATTFFDLPLWQKFGAWKPKTFASLFLFFFWQNNDCRLPYATFHLTIKEGGWALFLVTQDKLLTKRGDVLICNKGQQKDHTLAFEYAYKFILKKFNLAQAKSDIFINLMCQLAFPN